MSLIYVVEDDAGIQEVEAIALKTGNYQVRAFGNARDFYEAVREAVPDLVLLDIMLPDEDGYQIIRKLRDHPGTKSIPVIMVTARSSEMDMVKGLDDGADDYIKKPFSVMELLSRVKALLRRTADTKAAELSFGKICLHHNERKVTAAGRDVELTYKEYEMLHLFLQNPHVVLSREAIMKHVWNTDFEGESRTVDMHIKTLRQKLGPEGKSIQTVRNVGYVLNEAED